MPRNSPDTVDLAIALAAADKEDAGRNDAATVAASAAANAVPARGRSVPFEGVDVTGMPADLLSAETNTLRRLSPRRNRWPELGALDARVAELEARQADATARLQKLRERLAAEPKRHTDALAAWELKNRKGPSPEPATEYIERQLADADAEFAGAQRGDHYRSRREERVRGEAPRAAREGRRQGHG